MASTRNRILDAARGLFVDFGYAAVTHADIALEAGIGRTTFYDYFSSKKDVLVELVESRLPLTSAEMLKSIPKELDAASRFSELACRMVEFVATDPLGLLLHTDVPRLEPALQRRDRGGARGTQCWICEPLRQSRIGRGLPGDGSVAGTSAGLRVDHGGGPMVEASTRSETGRPSRR